MLFGHLYLSLCLCSTYLTPRNCRHKSEGWFVLFVLFFFCIFRRQVFARAWQKRLETHSWRLERMQPMLSVRFSLFAQHLVLLLAWQACEPGPMSRKMLQFCLVLLLQWAVPSLEWFTASSFQEHQVKGVISLSRLRKCTYNLRSEPTIPILHSTCPCVANESLGCASQRVWDALELYKMNYNFRVNWSFNVQM